MVRCQALIMLVVFSMIVNCEQIGNNPGVGGGSEQGDASDSSGKSDGMWDYPAGGDADADVDSSAQVDIDADGDADQCADLDSDGWCAEFDCDNNNPNRNGGVVEIPVNGVDDDCDGNTDEIYAEDTICDGQDFAVERRPVALMILQDLSGSMSDPPGFTGYYDPSSPPLGDPKWLIAKNAVKAILANPAYSEIRFGFDKFPKSGECDMDEEALVDAGSNNADKINAILENVHPTTMTPLYKALKRYKKIDHPEYAPVFTASGMSRYLLVVSDGMDTCEGPSNDDFKEVASDLRNSGIKTAVIGFDVGWGVNVNTSSLNAIAEEGGTEFTSYIDAKDQKTLFEAMDKFAESTLSCIIDIKEPQAAADPNKVNFYFDGQVVPYDKDCQSNAGWRWVDDAHLQAEFCEQPCAKLKSGEVAHISARFGCQSVQAQ